jgi:hypothetical protein
LLSEWHTLLETQNYVHLCPAVLGWQKTCESIDDITATLTALNTEIDISVFYRGLDPKNIRSLVSVVRKVDRPFIIAWIQSYINLTDHLSCYLDGDIDIQDFTFAVN